VTFAVTVNSVINNKSKIINTGTLTQVGGGVLPFEVTTALIIEAAIQLKHTLYRGRDGGAKCGTPAAVKNITEVYGTDVTHCFQVLNRNVTLLGGVSLTVPDLKFAFVFNGTLAAGASRTTFVEAKIEAALLPLVGGKFAKTLTNIDAFVEATPLFNSGLPIDTNNVTSSDAVTVAMTLPGASVAVNNTVYVGDDNGAQCDTSSNQLTDITGTLVTYCFVVTNTGNTSLNNIRVTNAELGNVPSAVVEHDLGTRSQYDSVGGASH
jgi:hypothetical protein